MHINTLSLLKGGEDPFSDSSALPVLCLDIHRNLIPGTFLPLRLEFAHIVFDKNQSQTFTGLVVYYLVLLLYFAWFAIQSLKKNKEYLLPN